MSQLQHLFDAEGRLRLDVQGRARLGAPGESCCCDSTCPNYVLVRWCCDPERTAWAWMNRPECPGHVPAYPSLSATAPQTFKVNSDPASACWTSDPIPEGNVRAYGDVPQGAVFIPFGEGTVLVDSCLEPACLNCPECCGSRTMPDGCGDGTVGGAAICCECGDGYTLTISEVMIARGMGTHYADPCTTFPAIGHTQPTWDHEVRRTATFVFGCEEVGDGNGGTFLRRKVTGQSVMTISRIKYYARIEYHFPQFTGDPCFLIAATQGRTEVELDETIERTWEELGNGGEGCGLTRRAAAEAGPSVGGLGTFGLSKHGVGVNRYDALGDCSGFEETWFDGCSVEAGGEFGTACRFGINRIGSEVRWSGTQNCDGGTFHEDGEYVTVGGLPVETIINGVGPEDAAWTGAERGAWAYDLTWSVSGGEECQVDPCQDQNPVGLTREKVRSERRAREIGRFVGKVIGANVQVLDAERLLAMALRGAWSDGAGCSGCGGGA